MADLKKYYPVSPSQTHAPFKGDMLPRCEESNQRWTPARSFIKVCLSLRVVLSQGTASPGSFCTVTVGGRSRKQAWLIWPTEEHWQILSSTEVSVVLDHESISDTTSFLPILSWLLTTINILCLHFCFWKAQLVGYFKLFYPHVTESWNGFSCYHEI